MHGNLDFLSVCILVTEKSSKLGMHKKFIQTFTFYFAVLKQTDRQSEMNETTKEKIRGKRKEERRERILTLFTMKTSSPLTSTSRSQDTSMAKIKKNSKKKIRKRKEEKKPTSNQ